MTRTQIYLLKSQIDSLRKMAQKKKTSVSEIVRSILQEELQRKKIPSRKHESLLDVAKRINAMGEQGPRDLATNLDAYLYGGK